LRLHGIWYYVEPNKLEYESEFKECSGLKKGGREKVKGKGRWGGEGDVRFKLWCQCKAMNATLSGKQKRGTISLGPAL